MIYFTEWDGSTPGENVGHVDGAGFGCEIWEGVPYENGSRFLGILKQSDMAFTFTQGEYPNDKFHGLNSRKRHTAQREVVRLLAEQEAST